MANDEGSSQASSMYTKRLQWSGQANSSVICTGDFDNWNGTRELHKDPSSGNWITDLQLPYGVKQVKYKFLVDGTWQHATDQNILNDDAGNTNNVFTVPEKPVEPEAVVPVSMPVEAETSEISSTTEPESQTETEGESSLNETSDTNLASTSVSTATTATEGEEADDDSNSNGNVIDRHNLPKTIQDLFANPSSSSNSSNGVDFPGNNGNGNGPTSFFNGLAGGNHPGLITYNMQNFATIKHLTPVQENYPSPFLTQGSSSPSSSMQSAAAASSSTDEATLTPTDVQIAMQYTLVKYNNVKSQAELRRKLKREQEDTRRVEEMNRVRAEEDKKLLEIEEGASVDQAEEQDEVVTLKKRMNGKSTSSSSRSSSKNQASSAAAAASPSPTITTGAANSLPPIQVLGIAKIYSQIKESNPTWSFSEKRLRKIVKEGEDHFSGRAVFDYFNEAERILRLNNLIGLGKLKNEVCPVSQIDPSLQLELENQWTHSKSKNGGGGSSSSSNGLPTGSISNGVKSEVQQQQVSPSSTDVNGAENKENQEPSSSSSTSKSKKKKNNVNGNIKTSSTPSTAGAIVNGISETAESVFDKVSSVLSPSTASNNNSALTSPSSPPPSTSAATSATAVSTGGPTRRNPTNAVGDVEVKWFEGKGRGVIARKFHKKDTVLFREDSFAFAPAKPIQTFINEGKACAFCGRFLATKNVALIVPCVAHDHLASSSSTSSSSTTTGRKGPPIPSSSSGRKVSANSKNAAIAKKEKIVNGGNAQANVDAENGEKQNKKEKESCQLKYCNKLCKDRATEMYANLTCPVVNPSYAALLHWVEAFEPRNLKMHPLGVFFIMLRLIVAAQKPHAGAREEALDLMRRMECLAGINERQRRAKEMHALADIQYGTDWLTGYRLVMEALQLPDKYYRPLHPDQNGYKESTSPPKKEGDGTEEGETTANDSSFDGDMPSARFYPGATLKRPEHGGINALPEWYRNKDLPEELAAHLLGFDNYLVWLGRVALNQEEDGGIYMLHACLNHACNSNASVRRTAYLNGAGARDAKPSRIFVIATRDIEEGEEINVTYVSANHHVGLRQNSLRTEYLFDCSCSLCESQLGEQAAMRRQNTITSNGEVEDSASSAPAGTLPELIIEEEDVFALALRAPPGTTVDEGLVRKMVQAQMNGHTNGYTNGNAASTSEDDEGEAATTQHKLSAATIKKKKKKAAAKLKAEQAEADAKAKALALDPMGFFSNNKPSTPWYDEDDI